MTLRVKYPRTPHLPGSPGATSDDRMLTSTGHFENQEIIVTEKLDGENTTMGNQGYGVHARSLSSAHHESRSWVKNLQANLQGEIPTGFRLCGENCFAKHSIAYSNLPGYFLLFSIWDESTCLSWDQTEEWVTILNVPTVPVLYKGPWEGFDPSALPSHSVYGATREGFVVRLAGGFQRDQFQASIAKWVRKNHVSTDQHWMLQQVIPNKLKESHS